MKSLTILVGLALCLVAVQARHYTDRIENEKRADEDSDNVEPGKNYRDRSQMRHRRKRWQMNYGYDYPPQPPNPYFLERRDYDRNQELIPQIWRLLDEISAYVKRPPPPPVPQPIYVPYPFPYPMPQNCNCNVQTPNITNRFPELEDVRQNWGIVTSQETDTNDDGSDGSRPISFEPIKPNKPMQRPQPEVEHGTNEAATSNFKEERVPAASASKSAGMCNAAILSCCSETMQQQRACFTRLGCGMTFSRGSACTKESIAAAIDSFRVAYSPSLQ